MNNPQKVILVAMTATGIVSIIENAVGPNLDGLSAQQATQAQQDWNNSHTKIPTILVGTFVAGALLLGISYIVPGFGAGLAVVALLATILERGKPFWEILTKLTSGTQTGTAPLLIPPANTIYTPAQAQSATSGALGGGHPPA